jgi:TFIIF-interacting CTD phosphatase-like protein
VIVFTASVQQYGDPVIDMLDPLGCVKERLFRSVRMCTIVDSSVRLMIF